MSAILTRDPLSDVEASAAWSKVPPALVQIVSHCLEKNPRQRFQSARDIAFGLEVLSGAVTRTTAVRSSKHRVVVMFGAAALVLAALGSALWVLRPAPSRNLATVNVVTLAALPFSNLGGNPEDDVLR